MTDLPPNRPHEIRRIGTSLTLTLRCSCGWWHRERRSQNGLTRSARFRAALRNHDRMIQNGERES
jgi:hypothetical protein